MHKLLKAFVRETQRNWSVADAGVFYTIAMKIIIALNEDALDRRRFCLAFCASLSRGRVALALDKPTRTCCAVRIWQWLRRKQVARVGRRESRHGICNGHCEARPRCTNGCKRLCGKRNGIGALQTLACLMEINLIISGFPFLFCPYSDLSLPVHRFRHHVAWLGFLCRVRSLWIWN